VFISATRAQQKSKKEEEGVGNIDLICDLSK
jgi:hypothetical protein